MVQRVKEPVLILLRLRPLCGASSIPGSGTSTCHECGSKRRGFKKERKKEKLRKVVKKKKPQDPQSPYETQD